MRTTKYLKVSAKFVNELNKQDMQSIFLCVLITNFQHIPVKERTTHDRNILLL